MGLQNDLLLKAARGDGTPRTPVWLMRQAGRILPEYRAIREKIKDFKHLVTNPELAAEITVQPVDILEVDAAIIFSDILVIPEAMGLPYQMEEKKGPYFPNTISSMKEIEALKVVAEDELEYVMEAVGLSKSELGNRVPLIGFAGAPWTVFCYMVEGSGSKDFSKARNMVYSEPELARLLLQKITDSTIYYLKQQIKAGADIVQVFDSWAGVLPQEIYRGFSLNYISQICDAINDAPVIVFCKDAHFSLPDINKLSCEVVGLDWNMPVSESRELIGWEKTLQGNLDPAVLYSSYDEVESATKTMIDKFGTRRHIANLGHGVYPDTDPDKVKCFVNTVKEYSSSQKLAT